MSHSTIFFLHNCTDITQISCSFLLAQIAFTTWFRIPNHKWKTRCIFQGEKGLSSGIKSNRFNMHRGILSSSCTLEGSVIARLFSNSCRVTLYAWMIISKSSPNTRSCVLSSVRYSDSALGGESWRLRTSAKLFGGLDNCHRGVQTNKGLGWVEGDWVGQKLNPNNWHQQTNNKKTFRDHLYRRNSLVNFIPQKLRTIIAVARLKLTVWKTSFENECNPGGRLR